MDIPDTRIAMKCYRRDEGNLEYPLTASDAYQNNLEDFCGFVGLASADEFRVVTRSHVWLDAPSSNIAVWPERRSGANWPRWPASLIISWRAMRSPAAIPCMV